MLFNFYLEKKLFYFSFRSILKNSFKFNICNMRENFNHASSFGLKKYPRTSNKTIQYGTSGFREKADELKHVVYRAGLLAVLRSQALDGKTIGMMITASHNPEEDNGVKLCDPSGSMLTMEWESFATELINSDDESIPEVLAKILSLNKINYNVPASVVLGKDTRQSSELLSQAAIDGIHVLNGNVEDFGLVTTPQLHYIVCCKNYPNYGQPTLKGYYDKLSIAFESLKSDQTPRVKYIPEVFVDGANGIGALKLRELQPHLRALHITLFNDGSHGILNHKCGADFVKFEQKPPVGCDFVKGRRYATVDGDADRLLYFYMDDAGSFHLLDGDKLAALFVKFLKDLVEDSGLELNMRVVQTAYANSASTNYIQDVMKVPVICVPTGVKHLHHEALKHDIGVYFEANGHGTALFSNDSKLKIKDLSLNNNAESCQQAAARKLLSAIDLINETCGDALSDLLMVETILSSADWSIEVWDAVYTDLPYKQMKVKVPDRSAIETVNAARQCTKPEGLQDAIDKVVSNYRKARSFIRPSGTEDIVRVYAEAETQEDSDEIAEAVSVLVKQFTS